MTKRFKKGDLKYKNDYSWKNDPKVDDPDLRNFPDDALFNRTEGHEVLYLVNFMAGANAWFTIAHIHRMEDLIKRLPGSSRSHVNVRQWIVSNWNN